MHRPLSEQPGARTAAVDQTFSLSVRVNRPTVHGDLKPRWNSPPLSGNFDGWGKEKKIRRHVFVSCVFCLWRSAAEREKQSGCIVARGNHSGASRFSLASLRLNMESLKCMKTQHRFFFLLFPVSLNCGISFYMLISPWVAASIPPVSCTCAYMM